MLDNILVKIMFDQLLSNIHPTSILLGGVLEYIKEELTKITRPNSEQAYLKNTRKTQLLYVIFEKAMFNKQRRACCNGVKSGFALIHLVNVL